MGGWVVVPQVDVEHSEWDAMPPVFDLIAAGKVTVGQVQIELHNREHFVHPRGSIENRVKEVRGCSIVTATNSQPLSRCLR